jgi:two-component system sensor histidine kinase/response regulator
LTDQAPLQILLVEDNLVNQLMAQGTLTYLGHDVTIAGDGQEAVDWFKVRPFDLILMDLMLPIKDGYQATAEILSLCQEEGKTPPPIVALSATLEDAEKARCREVGITQWLSKPISPEEFQTLIESLTPVPPPPPASPPPESGAPPPAASPINSADLMRRVRDPDALSQIVDLFVKSYPTRLKEVEGSLSPELVSIARRAAHTLKGNFLNFGSTAAAEAAHHLSLAIDEGRWEEVRAGLPGLGAHCASVEQALRQLMGTTPVPRPVEVGESSTGAGFTVIVADGDPANRALCSAALRAGGYEILEAEDGNEVLRLLAGADADVVLMGVLMAGLDGFETCRRIKADVATQMIPVLLLTARDERESRIEGMDAGADDFLSKPVDPNEVSLRVRNAARGKALFDRLQQSFEELQELEKLRDGLTHMLVHDLRTPLTAIKGYASLLTTGFGAGLTPQQKSFAEKMLVQSNRLVEMVSGILDVSRLESNQLPLNRAKVDLALLLMTQSDQFTGLPEHLLELEMADGVHANCDQELIGRVVANLLANAFKYTPKGSAVTLQLSANGAMATISVVDKGPGVPEASRQKIFEKFSQVEGEDHRRPYSSGLGLTFCQLVVQKHDGAIGVDEGPGGVGSRFWFTLPLGAASA